MTKPSRQKTKAICGCGTTNLISRESLNINIKRNGVYLCHHCATKKAGSEGKYSHTPAIRSVQTKKMWQRPEFRQKITSTSIAANTKAEYKTQQSQRTSALWAEPAYASAVSMGVRAALQDPIVRERIAAGVRRKWQVEQYRTAVISNLGRHKQSSLQFMLYEFLDNIGADYVREGPNTTIGYYAFDCLVRGARNILIECQGDYWHSLPKAVRNDRSKFTYITRYFPEYEIMYIWEHEFHTKDGVIDRLKLKLGLDIATQDFNFSDVRVIPISYALADAFLTKYHYLNKGRGGKAWGAILENELIACAVFSPPIRQNVAQQFGVDQVTELSRLCIHPLRHKKNFASWFLARVLPQISGPIVAYADTTIGHHGGVYRASNFRLHHTTEPDYWYVNRDGFVMHKKTLYNRAVNLKLSEAAFAIEYGYSKKYGGAKLCFTYRID